MMNKLFRRRRRRTTLLRMFLKGMILPVLITILLGYFTFYFVRMNAISIAESRMENIASTYIRRKDAVKVEKMTENGFLSLFGQVDYSDMGGYLHPASWIEPDAKTAVFTFDENGTPVSTNRIKMLFAIRWSEDPGENKFYSFDPQEHHIPEMDRIFDDYIRFTRQDNCTYSFHIESLYLEKETQKMVPHDIEVTRYRYKKPFLGYAEWDTDFGEVENSYRITIDYVPDGYTFTEMHSDSEEPDLYPRGSLVGIFGCEPEYFDQTVQTCKAQVQNFLNSDNSEAHYAPSDNADNTDGILIERIYGDEWEQGILTYCTLSLTGLSVWRRLFFTLGVLFCAMTLFVLAVCLIKSAENKAQYAFEDYQRALTNNLAHDLKTPLAVIGGYAENLLQMRQKNGGEKELAYLRSIMNNVSYTDDIIRKALKLCKTEQIQQPHKTEIDTRQLAEQLAEKYRMTLKERDITMTIDGSSTVSTDADLLTDTVENLISNAVRYTRNGGQIAITVDNKRLSIVNDTAEDVNTKNLLMPFVKGDKTRGDKRSSGLGLAIAAAAAEQNGFSLKISSHDRTFTAVLLF